jgi:hypothetical protein
MVLHTQEAALPPFINLYKWEENKSNGKEITLYLGKSNNPLSTREIPRHKNTPSQRQAGTLFQITHFI